MQQLLHTEVDIVRVRDEMRRQFGNIFSLNLQDITLKKIKEMVSHVKPAGLVDAESA